MNELSIFSEADSSGETGLPSRAVLQFIERVDRERICLHGFILLRRGQVAAEAYWAPYHRDSLHRMYSVSKSFVSLAVGLMIDQGKLRLDDPVADHLPDKLPPGRLHPYLQQTTVRDLLIMATPHSGLSYSRTDQDWARTFFNKQPDHPPGTIFCYDTAATVVLGTIVERLGNQPFLDFMRPHLLNPVGFSRQAWCIQTPEGTSWGGSGVICTLRDMARLALLCMRKGRWGDQQLISESYITAATTKQIDNSILDEPGYGYQIWQARDRGFAFRGMGGQFAFCFPDRDFLFACIADTQGADSKSKGAIETAMREELLARLQNSPQPEDEQTQARIEQAKSRLAILPQAGEPQSPMSARINQVNYKMGANPMGITQSSLEFKPDRVIWRYRNAQGENQLKLGLGHKLAGRFPQRNYFGPRIGTVPGLEYQCLGSAAWVDHNTLNMLVYITDNYLGTLKISMSFKDRQIAIFMTKVAEWFLDEYQGFAGGTAIDPIQP